MREKDIKDRPNRGRDELRPEYSFVDYSKAIRGKYYKRLIKEGANVSLAGMWKGKGFEKIAT